MAISSSIQLFHSLRPHNALSSATMASSPSSMVATLSLFASRKVNYGHYCSCRFRRGVFVNSNERTQDHSLVGEFYGDCRWPAGNTVISERHSSIDDYNSLSPLVVMSFHECGGNVGDDVHIPLPQWVAEIGQRNPDIFFTDKEGRHNPECLTWGIDKERVLRGRTAVEVYFDYMRSFRVEFDEFFEDGIISEIEIGLGPCGELRYPSYYAKHGWKYPGIGEFQVLVDHGDRVLALANLAFEGTCIATKLSGIHWWYKTASHAAELTAGFYNPCNRDGYAPIATMLKKHETALNFTCVELRTMDQNEDFPEALADPEGLVWQVLNAAWDVSIPVASENALPCYDREGYNKILENAKPLNDPDGRHLSAFTYLRLSPVLMENHNFMEFERFVKKMHVRASSIHSRVSGECPGVSMACPTGKFLKKKGYVRESVGHVSTACPTRVRVRHVSDTRTVIRVWHFLQRGTMSTEMHRFGTSEEDDEDTGMDVKEEDDDDDDDDEEKNNSTPLMVGVDGVLASSGNNNRIQQHQQFQEQTSSQAGSRRCRPIEEKERTKIRERQRRAVTAKILAGLRRHGNYNLRVRADINDVIAALAREAGWVVLPDGTTFPSVSQGTRPAGGASTTPMTSTSAHMPMQQQTPPATLGGICSGYKSSMEYNACPTKGVFVPTSSLYDASSSARSHMSAMVGDGGGAEIHPLIGGSMDTVDSKKVIDVPQKLQERDFAGTPCVPVYVMLPLGVINMKCELNDPDGLAKQLRVLKSVNVDGVMVDCWWGIVEAHAPQEYNWNGYKRLFQIVRELKLKLQVVMSFHECGGNVGDDVCIPLPHWVAEIGRSNPDIFFTDREGRRNPECLSWGIDKERVLRGRTAVEVYFDYMRSFRVEFDEFFEDGIISMIEVGLGPCGELRYPSNPVKHGWRYPGIHWWYKSASHSAELTAGYYNPCNRDGYAAVMAMLKKHGAAINFMYAEWSVLDQHGDFSEALADPEGLAWQVLNAAWDVCIPVASENALPCHDREGYNNILERAKPLNDPDGRHFCAFTYLRLGPLLMETQNFVEFERFVKRIHGEAVLDLHS
ncbi:hypothetical protein HYC85_007572 [Camellia sinensis]|uniref:Beta-amylase n=1 Tax=Camellia sinensis TaxID=4442 RepID=A0A7J7HRL3_CAMSI|nr:hypothetical protein HYC85_007572 [Camellia sinensis]